MRKRVAMMDIFLTLLRWFGYARLTLCCPLRGCQPWAGWAEATRIVDSGNHDTLVTVMTGYEAYDSQQKNESVTRTLSYFSGRRFMAKALPEPDLKYRSTQCARVSFVTATYERKTTGK
jgi:hypothetical protein